MATPGDEAGAAAAAANEEIICTSSSSSSSAADPKCDRLWTGALHKGQVELMRVHH